MSNESGDMISEGADLPVRPPTLFLGGLAAGAVLELIVPVGPGLAQGNLKAWAIGLALAAIGFALVLRAIGGFKAAGTSFRFDEPTGMLVTDGLHGISRNPIYIGLIVIYTGLAIALTSGWALILLPGLIAMLQIGVIAREETHMEARFGTEYRAYRKRVPRWL